MDVDYNKIKQDLKQEYNSLSEKINFLEFVKLKSYDIIKSSNLFDSEWYLSNYLDVKYSGLDPIKHFLEMGVFENCNPNAEFNTKEYLNYYPEIDLEVINPFVHYILYGISEQRYGNNVLINTLQEKYFVSVIMIIDDYNYSYSINSVLNQSFNNLELLIGFNKSFKNHFCEEYKTHIEDKKIKLFEFDNLHNSNVRNILLEESNGNVIAYLDSGNQWDSEFLVKMLDSLNNNPHQNCAYSNVRLYDFLNNKETVFYKKFNRKQLLEQNFIKLNSFVHLRKLYENKGGFDNYLSILYDWDLIIRFTENNLPLFVKNAFTDYYISNESNHNNNQLIEEQKFILEKFWTERYYEEYELIKDEFDQGYYLEKYNDVLKSNIHPLYHFLQYGYKENKNPNREFNMKLHKNKNNPDENPFIDYIKSNKQDNSHLNYYNQLKEIININSIFLSDFQFDKEPLVSIIIILKNDLFYLEKLLNTFDKKTDYENYELFVASNDSDSLSFFENYENIKFIFCPNAYSLSDLKNEAVQSVNGEYILFIDSDIEPTYGWLNELMGVMINNDNVGAVGATLINSISNEYPLSINNSCCKISENIGENLYMLTYPNKYSHNIFDSLFKKNLHCLFTSNSVFLTKKNLFIKFGGFNKDFGDYSGLDFNLRLNVDGYKVILATSALLLVNSSITTNFNHELFNKKWGDFLFKQLLLDKINKNHFFTDKKLTFEIITSSKNLQDKEFTKFFRKLIFDLNESDFVTYIHNNLTNYVIKEDVDILVSFSNEFDISKVQSRKNLIKILFLNNNISSIKHEWDLVLVEGKDMYDSLNQNFEDSVLYYVSNINDLSNEIIDKLIKNFK